MENEIWKDVAGYEGHYQVSSIGRVKSLDRTIQSKLIGDFVKKGILLTPSKRGKYLKVSLSKDSAIIQYSVHRIVATAFIDNPCNKKCVNHINGIKHDNRVENLEWVTYSENTKHSYTNQLQISQKGSDCSQSKTDESSVIEMRNIYNSGIITVTELAKKYGLSISTVSQILNRNRWKHI